MLDDSLREAVKKRDNNECQLDKLFGISHLTGVSCTTLEVHHKTYDRYGHEKLGDLILICKRCHDLLTDGIRRERFLNQQFGIPGDDRRVTPGG